jgi:hypothetical protein
MLRSADFPVNHNNTVQLSAYLATALTGLSETNRVRVFEISDAVAKACRRVNIELYEPRNSTDPVHHTHISDSDVFRFDRQKVSAADLLLYVADFPSTGAGQELIIAGNSMVPIVAVAHESLKVSRMVTGMPGDFTLLRYSSINGIELFLVEKLHGMRPALERRKKALVGYGENRIGATLERIRRSRDMTYEDVAAAFRIPNAVTAQQIEQCEKAPDLQNNLSVFFLRELAAALDVSIADLLQ